MITPINTVVTTEALASAVTIQEMRNQLGLFSDTSQDDLLNALGVAATEYIGSLIGTYLEQTTLQSNFSGFEGRMDLEQSNVTFINSVSYIDDSGMTQTVNSTDYILDNTGTSSNLAFSTVPEVTLSLLHTAPVMVGYSVFQNQQGVLNPEIRRAILLIVQDWFEKRGPGSESDFTVATRAALNLLSRHRRTVI